MHTSKIYVMSGTACDTISNCLKKTHTTYKISTARRISKVGIPPSDE